MIEKERLEKELRFLKESFEADIISKEEYERNKNRIEREISKKEISDVDKDKLYQQSKIEETNIKEEPKAKIEKEIKKEETKVEETKEEIREEPKEEKRWIEEKPEKRKRWIWWLIAIVLIVLLIYYYTGKKEEKTIIQENITCTIDKDCFQEGKIGKCLNPGTRDSKCEFIEPVEVQLTVINDNNCKSCDTIRVINILRELFPGIKENYIDRNSKEGIALISNYNIDMLPAYLLGLELNETYNFQNVKRAFIRYKDRYIMSNNASGANLYINREEIKNSLVLFLKSNQSSSLKAKENAIEVINNFEGIVNYKEIYDNQMGLKSVTFPLFLINNIYQFSGVHPAEIIKQKFCEFNNLSKCNITLSTNIK